MIEGPYEIHPATAMCHGGEVVAVNKRHRCFVDSGARYVITGMEIGRSFEIDWHARSVGPAGDGSTSRFSDDEFRFYRVRG